MTAFYGFLENMPFAAAQFHGQQTSRSESTVFIWISDQTER